MWEIKSISIHCQPRLLFSLSRRRKNYSYSVLLRSLNKFIFASTLINNESADQHAV